MTSGGRSILVRCAAIVLALAGPTLHAAPAESRATDAAPASAIKAAFLFNFAKFVQWPAEPDATGPLLLCVAGDTAVADALETIVRGRTIERRELSVRRLRTDGAVRECHLLYASGVNREQSLDLVGRLKNAPVFSVSDFERFAALGGVAHLFLDGSRMRFAINPAAAQRAKLRVSSQLLDLAVLVKDDQ